MMFSGIFTKSKAAIRYTAILGLVVLLVANCLDMAGYHWFQSIDVHNRVVGYLGLVGSVEKDSALDVGDEVGIRQ